MRVDKLYKFSNSDITEAVRVVLRRCETDKIKVVALTVIPIKDKVAIKVHGEKE